MKLMKRRNGFVAKAREGPARRRERSAHDAAQNVTLRRRLRRPRRLPGQRPSVQDTVQNVTRRTYAAARSVKLLRRLHLYHSQLAVQRL